MLVRRTLIACAGGLLALGGTVTLPPGAFASDTPTPSRVTVMGSLMSELGCPSDWDGSCTATDMAPTGDGTYALTVTVPAGSYEWKVRLNGSWAENYGADGARDGANLALSLLAPAELRFTYDHATHVPRVVSAAPPPPAEVTADDVARAGTSLRKELTQERFYFVMADRFDNGDPSNDTGGATDAPAHDTNGDGVVDRDDHGLDPTDQGMYHGGDLKGLLDRLDYIEGLGTTAIWLTPSFKNEPTQEVAPGEYDAGYHGYWITDFTQIDPHLGTNEELKQLIDAAHARGMKVFFDIITNHTADVLDYEDSACTGTAVPYRSKGAYPYRDASGAPFDDRDYAMGSTFPEVDAQTSFPYAPVFPAERDKTVKVPAWLNDPTMYHNRGTSTFAGEDSEYGDFPAGRCSALDDLWTERPEVVQGMIDIYQTWVRDAGVDGFRIDTVKHVNMDFWKRFAPALEGYAAQLGNDDFFMFGEVYDADPRFMSRYTTTGRLQATVDFGFQGTGVGFGKGRPTADVRDFYLADDYYTDADSNAYSQPTFLGNHDMGRVGMFLAQEGYADDELLQRDRLAHSLMYLTRGQPVVYYGDEQGFVGDGGDQAAREDMMPSEVASYNDNDLIGTAATTAEANFDQAHPMYEHLAALSALREQHPALADGAQVHRLAGGEAGIYAFSRIDETEQVEYLVALNNATTAQTAEIPTFGARGFQQIWGGTSTSVPDRDGRLTVTVPPLSAAVWRAQSPLAPDAAPTLRLTSPVPGGVVPASDGRAEIAAQVPEGGFNQVTFAYRPVGTTDWQVLGTDDNAPYRVFQDVSGMPTGTYLEYRAVVRDHDGQLAVANSHGFVGVAPPATGGGGEGSVSPVPQPGAVSVPGSLNSDMGCAGDWQPDCAQAQLVRRSDDIWSRTYDLPAGQYEYKVAIDRSWDENYGRGAVRNGSNIVLDHAGGPVTFFYDHRTHWVTSTSENDIWAAVGSFQSELGCPGDWAPDCLRSWMQDPDGDGVFVHRTDQLPAGTYSAKAAKNAGWTGSVPAGDVPFTVSEGDVVRFTLDSSSGSFAVSAEAPPVVPDLTTARATWVAPDEVLYDLPPGDRTGWSYRLHHGPAGSLAIDQETVGGESVPLTVAEEADGADTLRLTRHDAARAHQIAREGQLALAVYDARGRLVDATGVTVSWQRGG